MRDRESYEQIRQLAEAAPADFWGPVARRTLHWYRAEQTAWLSHSDAEWCWVGLHACTGEPARLADEWSPWVACVDESDATFVRSFAGGSTNAAFSELDRHVLRGQGVTAFISDSGEVHDATKLSELLLESVLAAGALTADYGLTSGQRVAFYLPNDARAVTWIEAAKRLGVPYVAVASGTASASLASRLEDTGAAALLTSEGLIPLAQEARELMALPVVGLIAPPTEQPPVEGWQPVLSALQRARARLDLDLSSRESVESLPPEALVCALWRLAKPLPVAATHPLFVLYTSGSTGKPKGIVHTHGGYQVGLCLTCEVVFQLEPSADVFLVIATPGWITGQSCAAPGSLEPRPPASASRHHTHPPSPSRRAFWLRNAPHPPNHPTTLLPQPQPPNPTLKPHPSRRLLPNNPLPLHHQTPTLAAGT